MKGQSKAAARQSLVAAFSTSMFLVLRNQVISVIGGFLGLQKMCLQSLKLAHRMRAASDFKQ
jgi:hypothetical protein